MTRKLILFGGMLFCMLLVIFNRSAAEAARQGFSVWQNAVLPALLPFFVCTELMQSCSYTASSVTLCALALVSGAPGGAKLFGGAEDATDIIAALNAVSPVFIISGFCCGMLHNVQLAWPIVIAQTLSALIMLLFALKRRGWHIKMQSVHAEPPSFISCIRNSVSALLSILGAIVFFMVALALLDESRVLFLLSRPLYWLLSPFGAEELAPVMIGGIIEMVSGCTLLAACSPPLTAAVVAAAFLFSFGGLCIMAQSLSFAKLNIRRYLFLKLLQAFLAALLAGLITPLFFRSSAVFLDAPNTMLADNALSAGVLLFSSTVCVAATALIGFILKRFRNAKNRGV